MYKSLLANRYLRTRFIALASIISVTLGVATMIVVNSVMSGFSYQMKDRIHGILADLMIESTSMDGTQNPPQELIDDVMKIIGDEVVAITPTMEIYGMMSFEWAGQTVNKPVTLIGIVPDGKDAVSPLKQYMLSRKAIEQDGKIIREPLRDMHEPLDWSLTEQAIQVRKERADYINLKSMWEDSYGAANRRQPLPEKAVVQISDIEIVESDETASPEATTIDLVDSTFEISEQSEPPTSEMPAFQDPFSSNKPSEKIDLTKPLSGKVFIGAGLVSFPYKDRDTGETRIMYMTQPGWDVNFTTISTGVPKPVSFPATVVDIFQSGMSEYDSNLVFCNLEELQQVRGMMAFADPSKPEDNLNWKNGAITTLQIKLKDYTKAPAIIRKLQMELPNQTDFQVRTWEQKQGPLLEAVAVESAILNVLLFMIIMVAGFGILATFYMIVVEKTRDIGILKSLGASSGGIMFIFLRYGFYLGVVGSSTGVALGLLFVYYINEIESLLSRITGEDVFNEAIYYFKDIPVMVSPMMVVWVALGAIYIALLASVLPAYRASQMHPVRALRSE